ncbi:unnamed protein product [Musa acuminata var. zebrina]
MDVAYICGGAGWAQCGSAIVFSPDLILAPLQPRQKLPWPCASGIRLPLHLHTRIHCVPLDSRRRCALDNEVPDLSRRRAPTIHRAEYLYAIRHVPWLMRTQVAITAVRRAVTKTCSVGRRVDHRRTSESPLVTVIIMLT